MPRLPTGTDRTPDQTTPPPAPAPPAPTAADRRYLLWRQARDAHGSAWANRNI